MVPRYGRPVTINGSPGPPGGAERSPQSHFGAILPICSSSARLEAKPTEVRRSHSKSVNIDLSSSDPGHSRAPRSLPIGSGLSRAVLDSSEALPVIRYHAAQKSCRRLRAPTPGTPRDRITLRRRADRTGMRPDDAPVDSDVGQPTSSTPSARSDGSTRSRGPSRGFRNIMMHRWSIGLGITPAAHGSRLAMLTC